MTVKKTSGLPECLCPHHRAFQNHVCPCGEALEIAIEALKRMNNRAQRITDGLVATKAWGAADYDTQVCTEALAKIERLGDAP